MAYGKQVVYEVKITPFNHIMSDGPFLVARFKTLRNDSRTDILLKHYLLYNN